MAALADPTIICHCLAQNGPSVQYMYEFISIIISNFREISSAAQNDIKSQIGVEPFPYFGVKPIPHSRMVQAPLNLWGALLGGEQCL